MQICTLLDSDWSPRLGGPLIGCEADLQTGLEQKLRLALSENASGLDPAESGELQTCHQAGGQRAHTSLSQTEDIMTGRDTEIPIDDIAILQLFKDNLLNHSLNGNSGQDKQTFDLFLFILLLQFPCQTECPLMIANCQTWSP